jgi:hypothetical protein
MSDAGQRIPDLIAYVTEFHAEALMTALQARVTVDL